jgi:hypothetical protein
MYTFSQARARLVATALQSLGRAGIVDCLRLWGSLPRLGDDLRSDRALAYRLAWLLLPAGAIYVEVAAADLDCYAVQIRTDARTAAKGGR